MEWTEETIARLRALWDEGLSTAEIGRQLSITKNAVVGKAHRLGLPSRPSPIRRSAVKVTESVEEKESGSKSEKTENQGDLPVKKEETKRVVEGVVLKEKPSLEVFQHPAETAPKEENKSVSPLAVADEKPASGKKKEADVSSIHQTKTETKKVPTPRPKRQKDDGLQFAKKTATCCWPIGDPGTKGFRFCGKEALPGKPYCFEHAQIAYVKLRDRNS